MALGCLHSLLLLGGVMSNRNIALKWLLIAALTVVCVAQMSPTQAYAQEVRIHLQATLPNDNLGETDCDSTGKPQIRLASPDGTIYNPILQHELRHVKQLNAHGGGCRIALAHYEVDAWYRFQVESEAYAVQVWADTTVSPMLRANTLAQMLWDRMGRYKFPEMSLQDVEDYVIARYGSNEPP
jgi:hypothetical protein